VVREKSSDSATATGRHRRRRRLRNSGSVRVRLSSQHRRMSKSTGYSVTDIDDIKQYPRPRYPLDVILLLLVITCNNRVGPPVGKNNQKITF
jgi:hypothetical protein